MGSMYWQFGDAWPNIGWSVIDYLGKKKAAYYVAKKAFKNVSVIPALSDTIINSDTKLNVFINSDSLKAFDAKLSIRLMNFAGKVIFSKMLDVKIGAQSNAVFYSIATDELLKGQNKNELVLSTVLSQNGRTVSENLMYFNHVKNLLFEQPIIKSEITQIKNGFEIEISTKKKKKSVYLSLPNGDDEFSDNFFDVLPNEKVKIKLNTTLSIKELKSKLIVRTLVDCHK